MSGRLLKTTISAINRRRLSLRRAARCIRSAPFASPLRSARLIAAVRGVRTLENDRKLDQSASEWQAILQSHPDAAIAHAGYGRILRKLNRLADSRAVLSQAIARFPRDFEVMFGLARTLQRMSLWPEAIGQGRSLVAQYPWEPRGFVLLGRIYRDARLVEQAEEMLLAGRKTSLGDIELACEYATVADVEGRRATAVARWQAVREEFPDAMVGYEGLGWVLKRVKRFDEADGVLAEGMARFPRSDRVGINHAWVAEARGDWPEALRRWEALWLRFPRNAEVEAGLVECRGKATTAAALQSLDGDHAVVLAPPVPSSHSMAGKIGPSLEHADLFRRFESLGDNCELGFVQRYFGAEPLGLFRWGGMPFDRLLHGFSTGFEDIGRAGSTELHINADNGEYFTRDKVLGLMTHSFMTRDSASEDVAFTRLCRRLQYLRGKFLEDLAAREKIFVHASQESLDERAFRQLIDAMTPYGAVDLLCLRLADEKHPAGTVDRLTDRLMVGYLDRLGYDGKDWNISFDVWRRICETSAAMVNARAARL